MTAIATAGVVDLNDARLVALDRKIDKAEDDGIRARWEFGREMLTRRKGKKLPPGELAQVAELISKSRSEIQARMRFAERIPTEEALCNAVTQYGSWHAVVNHLLAANSTDHPDEFYSPKAIFDALALPFDLDVCAPPGGVAWIPCAQYFTRADDGLKQSWHGRVWMNPPYSAPTPWVERFIEHRHGITLLPHAKSAWHIDLWEAADAVAEPFRYFSFERPSRPPGAKGKVATEGSIMFPTWFAAFGDDCVDALQRVGTVRVRPRLIDPADSEVSDAEFEKFAEAVLAERDRRAAAAGRATGITR